MGRSAQRDTEAVGVHFCPCILLDSSLGRKEALYGQDGCQVFDGRGAEVAPPLSRSTPAPRPRDHTSSVAVRAAATQAYFAAPA